MTKRELVAWGIAGLSCACAIGTYISHRRTASLLKKTVKELAEATPVEIEKDVVDAVVQEALEMKVDNQVDEILEETKKEIRHEICTKVAATVNGEMDKIHTDVLDQLTFKIEHISEDDVKKLVVSRASDQIEEKLNAQMDDILRQYQKRLDSINDMYVRMIQRAPQLTVANNVNPGLHLQW